MTLRGGLGIGNESSGIVHDSSVTRTLMTRAVLEPRPHVIVCTHVYVDVRVCVCGYEREREREKEREREAYARTHAGPPNFVGPNEIGQKLLFVGPLPKRSNTCIIDMHTRTCNHRTPTCTHLERALKNGHDHVEWKVTRYPTQR